MSRHGPAPCAHKGCAEEALTGASHCWEHTHDKDRYLEDLRTLIGGGSSLAHAHLKKAVLKGLHATKVDFTGADLSQADLSGASLFDCDFSKAYLVGTDCSDADLSHCDLRGADLTKADCSRARLWNADLGDAILAESSFRGADFWNARLAHVKLWRTDLEGAVSLERRNFSLGTRLGWAAKINESGPYSAEAAYRCLKRYFLAHGLYDDAGWAAFKEKLMERAILRQKRSPAYLANLMMGVLCGYGEKPSRVILSAIFFASLYAAAYYALDAVHYGIQPDYHMVWSDYLYYSVITFTTVGYGDFLPRAGILFRMLAASEAFTGIFLMGLFVFTLARRYSAR